MEVEDHPARLAVLGLDVVALPDDQQDAAEIDRPISLDGGTWDVDDSAGIVGSLGALRGRPAGRSPRIR
ncbi:hypothetical protein [Actinomadura parmotrematis]|uniref:Uncharacterized protein n=1 Tax=Actinomadura parmotrematis TaxID=2864039 RepID=A0ABS7G3P2_9ACTN|nr:hypothetical protein [Actinomadura parmotrematis]MBW8487341.1 hypothetical protein [Actinomadura parmotrematis]